MLIETLLPRPCLGGRKDSIVYFRNLRRLSPLQFARLGVFVPPSIPYPPVVRPINEVRSIYGVISNIPEQKVESHRDYLFPSFGNSSSLLPSDHLMSIPMHSGTLKGPRGR